MCYNGRDEGRGCGVCCGSLRQNNPQLVCGKGVCACVCDVMCGGGSKRGGRRGRDHKYRGTVTTHLVLNLQEGPLVYVVIEALGAAGRDPESEGKISGPAAAARAQHRQQHTPPPERHRSHSK